MTFKSKTIAGFGAALAILIFVGTLSFLSMVQSVEDRRWVTHTHLVLEKLDGLLSDLLDAETGQRGYIITGEESYLGPYNDCLAHAQQNFKALLELTADNPNQQRTLDRLKPLIAAKLAELQDRVNTRKQRGLAAGAAAVREGSGKQHMDYIRALMAEMKQEEARLLVRRSEELDRSSRRTSAMIVTGNALAFFLLFLGGLVINQEMGRRRRAEDEVRQLNADLEQRVAERTADLAERAEELKRSNVELQQFAYVASHDLQEPLRMVASFTQLLAKRYNNKLDDDARDFINYAVDGATRMQTLIRDLLAYSRVGTQGKAFAPTRCDEVVDRVLDSLKLAIKESRAAITRGPLPTVQADAMQLSQLFQNLLTNAIKFRDEKPPRVHISAERNGSSWKISVRDKGIGFSPEHAERIFVIFQRLHTKSEYPGTGIGLAICKKIVERHGGRISVESAPGEGSTFSFTIPAGERRKLEEREHNGLRVPASSY